jgi:hypothetical protein
MRDRGISEYPRGVGWVPVCENIPSGRRTQIRKTSVTIYFCCTSMLYQAAMAIVIVSPLECIKNKPIILEVWGVLASERVPLKSPLNYAVLAEKFQVQQYMQLQHTSKTGINPRSRRRPWFTCVHNNRGSDIVGIGYVTAS